MPVQVREAAETKATGSAIAARIYLRHGRGLLAIARRNSSSSDEAEEALQDALILFIENYDPASGAPALAWLTLTLKRRCWAIAKRARYQEGRLRDAAAGQLRDASRGDGVARPEAVLESTELAKLRRQHLSELKVDERRALILTGLGYSYREICAITGWSYTKVNRCIKEGRLELRRKELSNR